MAAWSQRGRLTLIWCLQVSKADLLTSHLVVMKQSRSKSRSTYLQLADCRCLCTGKHKEDIHQPIISRQSDPIAIAW